MTTYREAGVDIDAAEKAKQRIKEYVKETRNELSVMDAGFFCGGIKADFAGYKEPALMLSTDGVGTKMAIARMMSKYDTVGYDVVNHCANDILTSGAKPIFFLDYIASDRINPEIAAQLVKGVAEACRKLNVVLAGGETAQMPGTYMKGEHELAGTMGGVVERAEIIDGSSIKEGDALIGIASTGLHTNGYSLARKIAFETAGLKTDSHVPELGRAIGNVLLEPHREYVTAILELKKTCGIKGIAHITGGGITDNLPRILPNGIGAEIRKGAWEILPIFKWLQEKGNVPEEDMHRTFNMGIGLIIAVDKKEAIGTWGRLKQMGEKAWIIGQAKPGKGVMYA
ncbi:phosphoribosylformylglycinamidine cyclo-ligase [Candidatus Woesearchaeota archaeon]|nr:phosphoribosylformylglycinamidine cyclo-ligase [Candidatus Woesearchaeota archaeon]